jgi:putative FmdB family regulatory protein
MPIYEYRCEDCGTKFEKLVRRMIPEAPGIECPSCGQKHLKQELSTFAAHATGLNAAEPPKPPSCPAGGPCHNPGGCGGANYL